MPGIPAECVEPSTIDPTDVFVLHYRMGSNLLFLHFRFTKPDPSMSSRDHFRLAVERAKLHCEKMRFRFNFCLPFLTDLEKAEERMPI